MLRDTDATYGLTDSAARGDHYLHFHGLVEDLLGVRSLLSKSGSPVVQNPDIDPEQALESQVKSAERSVAIEKQPEKAAALLS